MTIKDVLNMGFFNNEKIYIRDEDFHLLAHGGKESTSITKFKDFGVESFTWEKDGKLYFDIKNIKHLRIIVAGSRNFTDYPVVEKILMDYLKGNLWDIEIVSGTAKGADLLGERFASTHGYPIARFPANWAHYGKSAGPIRNKEMAAYAAKEYGVLFAFWNGKSRGTKSMIELAKQYGLEVHIIRSSDSPCVQKHRNS